MINKNNIKVFIALSILFSMGVVAFTDEEWASVKMCGSVLYGKDPCDYVEKVVFNISYPISTQEKKEILVNYMKSWVERNEEKIYKKIDVKINNMKSGIRSSPARDGEAKIFIMVFPVENDGVILTLSTETQKVYQVYSYYCEKYDLNETGPSCLKEKINEGLEFLMRGFLLDRKNQGGRD